MSNAFVPICVLGVTVTCFASCLALCLQEKIILSCSCFVSFRFFRHGRTRIKTAWPLLHKMCVLCCLRYCTFFKMILLSSIITHYQLPVLFNFFFCGYYQHFLSSLLLLLLSLLLLVILFRRTMTCWKVFWAVILKDLWNCSTFLIAVVPKCIVRYSSTHVYDGNEHKHAYWAWYVGRAVINWPTCERWRNSACRACDRSWRPSPPTSAGLRCSFSAKWKTFPICARPSRTESYNAPCWTLQWYVIVAKEEDLERGAFAAGLKSWPNPQVASHFPVLVAANRAVCQELQGQMTTKNVFSQTIYCMSPSTNVRRLFIRRFCGRWSTV